MLGHRLDDKTAQKAALREANPSGSGQLTFEQFACYAARYVEVEEDLEATARELREAFLLYDKEGAYFTGAYKYYFPDVVVHLMLVFSSHTAKGYITVKVLRDILHELDDKIPPGDLDLMIEEIDADGSGTVDFEGKSIFE